MSSKFDKAATGVGCMALLSVPLVILFNLLIGGAIVLGALYVLFLVIDQLTGTTTLVNTMAGWF